MPVFFIHDPGQGTITPTPIKSALSRIEPTSETGRSLPVKAHSDNQEKGRKNKSSHSNSANKQALAVYSRTDQQRDDTFGVVADYMRKQVISCLNTDTLERALQIMEQHAIHHVAVVDNNGALNGLLSESSILKAFTTNTENSPLNLPVQQICHPPILSTSPFVRIEELAEGMLENELSGIAVTEGQAVVGIITRSDLMKVLLRGVNFEEET